MIAPSPRFRLLASAIVLAAAATVSAQDWPHWRGPSYDGSTEAKSLPTDFDQEKGVRWALAMPGPGACTPIVVGDRVFLTSVDTERERLVAMCVERSSGKVKWQRDAGSGYRPGDRGSRVAGGRRATYASPSPVTDGERVVFFFGNGDLVAYDLEGEEQWRRNIQREYGNFAFNWTFSASPTFWDGKLFLPVLQRDVPINRSRRRRGRRGQGAEAAGARPAAEPAAQQEQQEPVPIDSFVLAMDPKTGETLYKHVRPAPARMESLESYTTMVPFVGPDGRKELLLIGGDVITGHDPETGKELWRWGTWNEGHRRRDWRIVPSPVVSGGVAIVCAPKRAPVYAIKLGGDGELNESAIVWQSEGRRNPVSSDVPTPAFYAGHLFVLGDGSRSLSKVAPKNGEVLWTTQLPGDALWRASPTAADGKIWCINHHGDVVIVGAEDGDVVARIAMGEEDDDLIRSSIVVAHGSLFIRTNKKLFCIGG